MDGSGASQPPPGPSLRDYAIIAALLHGKLLEEISNAHFGFHDFDDEYRLSRRASPRSDIWPGSFTAPGLMRAHRIATACKGATMGLSRQLPILQLRPMHGHRERYCRLLRDQSPLRVRAPAARRLSAPILSGSHAEQLGKGLRWRYQRQRQD